MNSDWSWIPLTVVLGNPGLIERMGIAHLPPGAIGVLLAWWGCEAILNQLGLPLAVGQTIEFSAGPDLRIEFLDLPGERIPLGNGSVDTVVSTFTLCTVSGVTEALHGVGRVLRPGGKFIFFEHRLSPDPHVQRWQRWSEPIPYWVANTSGIWRCMAARNSLRGSEAGAKVTGNEVDEVYCRGKCGPFHGANSRKRGSLMTKLLTLLSGAGALRCLLCSGRFRSRFLERSPQTMVSTTGANG
jgi:SAM-dependent methyltransferase